MTRLRDERGSDPVAARGIAILRDTRPTFVSSGCRRRVWASLQRRLAPDAGKGFDRARRWWRAGLVAAALLVNPACGRRVDLGEIGDGAASLLWSASFEPGDLSEWLGDGERGTFDENTAVAAAVTGVVAHRGRFAGRFAIAPTASIPSTSYLFRNLPSPRAAYYSAWFYIPSPITVPNWLSLIHFTGSRTGDGKNLVAVWDVNLYSRSDGSLVAQLYDYADQINTREVTPLVVPLDAWVKFDVLFVKAADSHGAVAVWQDGTLILNRPGIATLQNDWLQWDAGAASDAVTPSHVAVYLDDAAISTVRLGDDS